MNDSMKHPSIKTLQAYFESETKDHLSHKLSLHIKECDKCCLILSEMAKVDILFAQQKESDVSENLKNMTFSKAKSALQKRRQTLKNQEIEKQIKSERKEKLVNFVSDYRRSLFQDLKLPALQTSALFVLIGILTEISRTEVVTIEEKVINNEFTVFYSESEGESHETK